VLCRADLYRIKGIGQELSDLLEAAGESTPAELSHRVPRTLHARILELNEQKKLVRRLPSLSEVERWVSEAKSLDKVGTH
jgi:predicted flap endonuclease-1-like 5' DNA nuclease